MYVYVDFEDFDLDVEVKLYWHRLHAVNKRLSILTPSYNSRPLLVSKGYK